MNKIIIFLVLVNFVVLPDSVYSNNQYTQSSDENVSSEHIEIIDWDFYVASRVAILYNLTLENKSDYTFDKVEVRINYYSRYPTHYGKKISHQSKVLKINLPPKTRKTFYKDGVPLGLGSQSFIADNLEIISANISAR